MRVFIMMVLFLMTIGCQVGASETDIPEITLTQEDVQESSQENQFIENSEAVSEAVEEEMDEEESSTEKAPGGRRAWTDYSAYASPNEEGHAYYIHDDPDISSEVFPLVEEADADVLLFTFDDAPQMPDSYALEIAQTLKAKDVNAIFLVNGMYLENEEGYKITKQLYEMGFEIGNHTQTHPALRDLTYEEQYREIETTSRLIEEVTGEKPRWFRPPFGLYNLDTILICNELGMQLINWTFGYDWMDDYLEADALAEISLENPYLHSGANILMHDRYWTAKALERMIDGYRQQGYIIVDPLLIATQENSIQPME